MRHSKQACIYALRHLTNHVPRMPLHCVSAYLAAPILQVRIKVARKVGLNCLCQVDWILWPEHKPGAALDDLILQRAHLGSDYRQAKNVPCEQNAALINLPIGQHKNICRLEINLCLVIRNEFRLEQYLSALHVFTNFIPNCCPVFLALEGLPTMIKRQLSPIAKTCRNAAIRYSRPL